MKVKGKGILRNVLMSLLLPVAIYVIFVVITNGQFGGAMALRTIARQSIVPIIVAMSISFDMMQGGWDFSAGAVVYASAIFGANLGSDFGLAGVILFSMLVALVLCALSGLLFTWLKIPALVLSIGMLMLYESLPRLFFKTGGVVTLSMSKIAQPPYCFVVFAIVFVLYYIVSQHTLYGHNVRAIGANQAVAGSTGVNIARVKFTTFLVKGFLLGSAGFMYMVSNIKVACPDTLTSFGLVFDGLMGTFIAMFLRRYSGLPFGIVIGIFSMKILTTAMVSCGMQSTVRSLVTGIFLLVLLCLSSNQAKFLDWLQRRRIGKQVAQELGNQMR